MIVYRLETTDGRGAYHHLVEVNESILVRCHSDHPSPEEDGMPRNKWNSNYIFGFASMDDLHAWFPKELMMPMHRCDLQLTQYDVPDRHVCRGRTQLAFDAYEGDEIDRRPLIELAKEYSRE